MSILHDQKDIEGSPFKVRVFDPSKIRVGGLKGGMVGKPLEFSGEKIFLISDQNNFAIHVKNTDLLFPD